MEKECGRCKKHFSCNTEDIDSCDCSKIKLDEKTKQFLSKTYYDCLCNNCLKELNDFSQLDKQYNFPNTSEEYLLNVHYYIENEFWVFTEFFHYQKGSCCKNKCRHCAYGYFKK